VTAARLRAAAKYVRQIRAIVEDGESTWPETRFSGRRGRACGEEQRGRLVAAPLLFAALLFAALLRG